MILYRKLTEEQKNLLTNGCGPRRFFTINGTPFTASCRQYDFHYARGHSFTDKVKADSAFYRAMLRDVKTLWAVEENRFDKYGNPYRILWASFKVVYFFTAAQLFYVAVFFAGHFGPFRYGQRFATLLEMINHVGQQRLTR